MNSSPNIIRVIKLRRMLWVRHVERIEEMIHSQKILFEKPEVKRPVGKFRYR